MAKIEAFTTFQPHPVLMGYNSLQHFSSVPPKEHNARIKFDADFAKMLAKDIMHIRKHWTTASPYLVTPFYQSGEGEGRANGRVIGDCVRSTTNFIKNRAGGNPYDLAPTRRRA